MAALNNQNVLACVHTVNSNFPEAFILVGGASMVTRRSNRSTNDVDILVSPSTNMGQLYQKLVNTKLFYRGEGSLFVRPSGSESNTSMRPLKIVRWGRGRLSQKPFQKSTPPIKSSTIP